MEEKTIDLREVFSTVWAKRKVFYWVLPLTFVLSCALILCVPRYYSSKVVMAPEQHVSLAGGALGSLASNFGLDLGGIGGEDAIYPSLYPDVISSPDFLIELFDLPVSKADGSFEGTYFDYLKSRQKYPFWIVAKNAVFRMILPKPKEQISLQHPHEGSVDKFCLTRQQNNIVEMMQEKIRCTVDKKNDLITIYVQDQDPLICATVAEAVSQRLQDFMTDYRTQKAKSDIEYYSRLIDEAYDAYLLSSRQYIDYMDGHANMNLERYRVEANGLQEDMNMKFSAYTSFQKQYLASQAKLQENTPIFTVLRQASIPILPAGPKRVLFVLAMCVLATIIVLLILSWKELRIFE